jgi:hypothetical protein
LRGVKEVRSKFVVTSVILMLTGLLTAAGCQSLSYATPTATALSPTPVPTVAPVTPTPSSLPSEVKLQPYLNRALGISLTYPADWLLSETERGVVFGTSSGAVAGGELVEGAGLALYAARLSDPKLHSVEELCASEASVFASEQMEISDPLPRLIGEEKAAVVTLDGTPALSQTPIRGLVAVTVWAGWQYTFVGLSTAEDWKVYGGALEGIVDEVEFMARELPQYEPDAWEPDDSVDQASEIEAGSAQTHDLHRWGDQDFACFEATRGYVYTIETSNLGGEIDTRVYLYDAQGNLLAQNDDGRSEEELWASRLIWTAEKSAALCLMVEDVGGDDAGPGTVYDVRVWEEVRFVEDEYEPDDRLREATLLTPGTEQIHNLHVLGDHDWVYFQAQAGTTYLIETYDLGPEVDTVLHLLDEEGNELAVDDNGRAEEARASRIQWMAESDALLYVVAHDVENDAAGLGTEYGLRIIESRP